MEDFVKRMIEEHSQLIIRISALHDYVYSERSDKDDKIEFGNKCIQLNAMKTYEQALRTRLENQGVVYADGVYYNKLAEINEEVIAAVPASNVPKDEIDLGEGNDGKQNK